MKLNSVRMRHDTLAVFLLDISVRRNDRRCWSELKQMPSPYGQFSTLTAVEDRHRRLCSMFSSTDRLFSLSREQWLYSKSGERQTSVTRVIDERKESMARERPMNPS